MEWLGAFEEYASELYPYRYIVGAVLALAAAAAAYAVYRRGWYRPALRHPVAAGLIGVPLLVAALVAGNYLLSPLWERSRLDEASPFVAAGAPAAPTGAPAPVGAIPMGMAPVPAPASPAAEVSATAFAPRALLRGMFMGADSFHFGRGDAILIEVAPGKHVLRFESFSVRNGPDLFVYLSPDPDGFDHGALNLGKLKATDGAFNYEVPEGTDISRFRSAVVWCKQFGVLFATATFAPPG